MPRATTTPPTTKRQKAAEPEALRLKYEHRESMWLLGLATLIVLVGLACMVFHVPGSTELVGVAFSAMAGKSIIKSGPRNKHP